jgi:3-dehydroquinate dehydratase-2
LAGLRELGQELGAELEDFQSNHEGALLDVIHQAMGRVDGIVINPGGLGHTSVCLRDALLAVGIPFVEVHLTNIQAREPFRHRTLLSDLAIGTVAGFGGVSYSLGLRGLLRHLRTSTVLAKRGALAASSGESE